MNTHRKLAEDAKRYGHEYSVLLKEDGFPTGITSRYPIEDVKKVREGFHHGLLRARIQDIYFYVIHLHPSNHEVRKKEIALILNDIEQLPAGSEVILAGDFNTFSQLDSVYYAHGRLESFFSERDKKYNERNLNNGRLDYDELRSLMGSGLIDLEAEFRTPPIILQEVSPQIWLRKEIMATTGGLIMYLHQKNWQERF
jgi:exodeoxyribonuclease III